ncbi:hypothetical protein [Mycobacterium sp. 94-17]|uniref:hypothetical protein n=1 Tax=Mycobacterium sp. 94-17 TaxID=2986147 RepID=UPI002D1EB207|nr:hypothetical protein [Mycobacterium sp. 94-17]MEB4208934.1 hypothetical protein [Mycobacterium sp. 94-17]
MTLRLRGLVPAWLMLALALLLAPPTSADTYTDQLVHKFDAQTHVVVDPGARPPLQNPDKLNRQILTGPWTWSPGPPVWVAAVSPAQSGVTTADAVHDAMLVRDAGFSGVILVIDSHGYHVRAYNVPRTIADDVDRFMKQSAKDHRNDPYGATSDFVAKLSNADAVPRGPATTSAVAHQKHDNSAWLKVTLAVLAIGLAITGVLWLAVRRNRKHRKDTEAREEVKQELIVAASDVSDLDNAVLTDAGADVSAESLKANSSLHDARSAYAKGDYGAARAHLRVVQSTVTKANRKLDPSRPMPDAAAVNSVPPAERKQATVRATNPDTGESVTIDNSNYSTTAQPGYPHYYGGGYHNGMFFYPGYYPYAFWGPGWTWALTDVLLMDALLNDHWGGSYERGFEAGRDSAFTAADGYGYGYDGGQATGYDSTPADVGFTGDSAGGWDSGGWDSGGSDFGGGSDSGGGDFGF